jgi:orotate phosphoribosyltransferase
MDKMAEWKRALIELLLLKSYKYRDDPPFTLVSGRLSNYYFNCKPTMCNPLGKELIGRMIFELIRGQGIEACGGLALGSVPMSGAVSLISQLEKEPIAEFIVRKEKKDHGDIAKIEGDVVPGQRAVVFDDVITTGGSTIAAIEAALNFGLIVVQVVVIIDRQEGGREVILDRYPGIGVEALATRDEVATFHKKP